MGGGGVVIIVDEFIKCVGGGVGCGVFIGVDGEVDSNVGVEVGELVELEVGGKFVFINMSKMKSMWRFWNFLIALMVESGVVNLFIF